jgi:hypothetical protein
MYEEILKEFASSTRANFKVIESLKKRGNNDVCKTTQLINSCLGLLILPQQEFYDKIPTTPLNELKENDWPIPKAVNGTPQAGNLSQLFSFLRNAISHSHIKFITDNNNQVKMLNVWNENLQKQKTWDANLSIEDLFKLLNKFSELIIKNH